MEFASELHDFLRQDIHKWYPDLEDKVREGRREEGRKGKRNSVSLEGRASRSLFSILFFQVSVTLVEASNHILGTFDRRLVDYVGQVFQQRKVRVLTDTRVVKVSKHGVGEGRWEGGDTRRVTVIRMKVGAHTRKRVEPHLLLSSLPRWNPTSSGSKTARLCILGFASGARA